MIIHISGNGASSVRGQRFLLLERAIKKCGGAISCKFISKKASLFQFISSIVFHHRPFAWLALSCESHQLLLCIRRSYCLDWVEEDYGHRFPFWYPSWNQDRIFHSLSSPYTPKKWPFYSCRSVCFLTMVVESVRKASISWYRYQSYSKACRIARSFS